MNPLDLEVVGLDLSLTCTGWSRAHDHGTIEVKLAGPARLAAIRTAVLEATRGAHLAIIEGYAFGARTNREVMGELGGVIRVALYGNKIPYVVVAPVQLKKFATGNVRASKGDMLGAAIRQLAYDGGSDDVADAMWLHELGLYAYGCATVGRTQYRDDVIAKHEWPLYGSLAH